MGYCPRCGENSTLSTTPNFVGERRQPLRIAAKSNIISLPPMSDGDAIYYGGMRFRVECAGEDILLWAIE
ncbi:MAG TPA: hypothetical protein VNE17_10645 [Nitrolancea sp.]|nr:hypothetical protein [Nitrolancea sp.]